MSSKRTVFHLRLRYQAVDQICSFSLIRDGQPKELYARKLYSQEMEKLYRRWRSRYLQYYDPRSENAQASDLSQGAGALRISSTGDLSADVRRREEKFCDFFLNWLATDEAAIIEREIWPVANQNISLDIYLSCDHERLRKLPWEIWARQFASQSASPDAVRLIRTTEDDRELLSSNISTVKRSGKPRILAVIAQDPELEPFLEKDLKALKTIERAGLANIESFKAKEDESRREVIQRLCEVIQDDRGWDGLLFVGHSDDKTSIGGAFQLRPNIVLFMQQLAEPLRVAQGNGLRLAIFNSCSGLLIAESLIKLGIQAVVMREPIRSDVALAFLQQLCEGVRQKQDVHEAVIRASEYLRVSGPDSSEYPSAYLLPSFFSPSRIVPFRLEDYGWRKHFKRWRPTKREAITLVSVFLISNLHGIYSPLLELRVSLQAAYREFTGQVPAVDKKKSEITLLLIDQNYLKKNNIDHPKPIPRDYLAQVIEQAVGQQPKLLGVNYIIDTPSKGGDELVHKVKNISATYSNNIIFATSLKQKSSEVFSDLKRLNNILEGNSDYGDNRLLWKIALPGHFNNQETCPFSYLLALNFVIQNDLTLEQKNLLWNSWEQRKKKNLEEGKHDESFCEFISTVIAKNNEFSIVKDFLEITKPIFGWQSIIDFSIPPEMIYSENKIVSDSIQENILPKKEEILNSLLSSQESTQVSQTTDKIIIIGAGLYEGAKDDEFPHAATLYLRCHSRKYRESEGFCERRVKSSEIYAYMLYQLLNERFVYIVPTYWVLLATTLLSKIVSILMLKLIRENRHKVVNVCFLSTLTYWGVSLHLYIVAGFCFPILLPSFVFWNNIFFAQRRVSRVS